MTTETGGSFKSLQGGQRHRSCFWGCGLGLLGVAVCVVGVVWLGMHLLKKGVDNEIERLESQGFVLINQGEAPADRRAALSQWGRRSTVIKESPAAKALLVGGHVWVNTDTEGELAIIAKEAEINGVVKGTLYFRGQALTIGAEGVIEGDLDVMGQLVMIMGDIHGDIKGTYKELLDERQGDVSIQAEDPCGTEPATD